MTDIKKYDEINEISDRAVSSHKPEEYTYIINAEKYQKTGELEVKRVLKADLVPQASVSYVFFKREGCQGYPLSEKDLYLKSPQGYVGPFQMNGNACNAFIKHICQTHPEWEQYAKGKGTAGYMNFVKKCPDKEELLKTIEQYALSDYFNNRSGKPKTLAADLASHFKKVDENGDPNATRLPLHVIASLPTGVIARGNGVKFQNKIPTLTEQNIDSYCKLWISDKTNGTPAFNKLKEIDYITPEIIAQYQTMNLAGADELQQQFQTIVAQRETAADLSRIDIKELLKQDMKIMTPEVLKLPPELYGRKAKFDIHVDNKPQKPKKQKKTKNTTAQTNLPNSLITKAQGRD